MYKIAETVEKVRIEVDNGDGEICFDATFYLDSMEDANVDVINLSTIKDIHGCIAGLGRIAQLVDKYS